MRKLTDEELDYFGGLIAENIGICMTNDEIQKAIEGIINIMNDKDAVEKLSELNLDGMFAPEGLLAMKEMLINSTVVKYAGELMEKLSSDLRCCGNCKHRYSKNLLNSCNILKCYCKEKGACSHWELAE